MGSSGAGSGLQSQPLVVEGILVLVLGCFHCGKRRHSNYTPRSVLKSLLLKALLSCAAECSWFHVEGKLSANEGEGRLWESGAAGDMG